MTRRRRGDADLPPGPDRDLVDLLRQLRLRRGASVGQIATRAGLSRSHVSEVLHGWKTPSPRAAAAITRALDAGEGEAVKAYRWAEQARELQYYQRTHRSGSALAGGAQIGQLLDQARVAAGLTPEQLAQRSTITLQAITALERGKTSREPPAEPRKLAAESLVPEPSSAAGTARTTASSSLVTEPDMTVLRRLFAVSGLPGCRLPAAAPDFTGRPTEAARLSALLVQASSSPGVQMAVISGPPGVGKTALALQVAHSVRPSFPDGQLYVHMDGSRPSARSPGEVLGELLRALGIHGSAIPELTAERAGLFRAQTCGHRILIVVDDAASADQVRPLLPGTPGSAVMVTSRSRLGGLAGAHLQHLGPLPHSDAVQMLSRIVGHQRVAAEANEADRLVSACGRVPLAVRIAGARLATRQSWPVARVAEVVADQRRRLDELAVDDLAFRASVTPSYQALDDRAKRAFRRLGMLGQTDVAEWVVAALLDEPHACDVVNLLVDKSLLEPVGTDATGEPRYRMHDLLCDYASEQLDAEPEPERNAALVRVLTGWLELATVADDGLPRVPGLPRRTRDLSHAVVPATLVHRLAGEPVAWFTSERLNLAMATRHARIMGRLDLAIQLGACQSHFLFLQARLDEADRMWRSIIAAADSAGDTVASSHAKISLVPITAERGRNAEAMADSQVCLDIFEQLGDRQSMVPALLWCAYCAEQQNLLETAQHNARRSIGIARSLGDSLCELSGLRVLGVATTRLGDHANGVRLCERALSVARELHQPYAEFETLQTLAYAHGLAGGYEAAVELCLRGIDMACNLGYAVGEAYVLGPLGDAYQGLGRHAEAIEAFTSALRIFREGGLQRGHALCLLKMALSYMALGSHEQATRHLKASIPEFRELQMPAYEKRALEALEACGNASGYASNIPA